MPCYYTGSREGDMKLAREESDEKIAVIITNLTAMLCGVCEECNYLEMSDDCNPIDEVKGLREWWIKHKKMDDKRKYSLKIEDLTIKQFDTLAMYMNSHTKIGIRHIVTDLEDNKSYILLKYIDRKGLGLDPYKKLLDKFDNEK